MPPLSARMLRSRSGARAAAKDFCAAKNRTIIHESTLAKSAGGEHVTAGEPMRFASVVHAIAVPNTMARDGRSERPAMRHRQP